MIKLHAFLICLAIQNIGMIGFGQKSIYLKLYQKLKRNDTQTISENIQMSTTCQNYFRILVTFQYLESQSSNMPNSQKKS